MRKMYSKKQIEAMAINSVKTAIERDEMQVGQLFLHIIYDKNELNCLTYLSNSRTKNITPDQQTLIVGSSVKDKDGVVISASVYIDSTGDTTPISFFENDVEGDGTQSQYISLIDFTNHTAEWVLDFPNEIVVEL